MAVSIAVAVGMVLALLFAWLARAGLMRAIVLPVDAAIAQFQRIANDDLTARPVVTSDNEMGKLSAALQTMQNALIRMVGAVREGTESIDTGVSEIASGNTDQGAEVERLGGGVQDVTMG